MITCVGDPSGGNSVFNLEHADQIGHHATVEIIGGARSCNLMVSAKPAAISS